MDINELCRLAQAATPGPWIGCGPSFGESLPKYLNEVVVDREGDEDDGYSVCTTPIGLEDQCSDDMAFIAATNPAAITKLLDRLEAAEKERDWHAERCEDAMNECDALRAKIEAMENQKPVGEIQRANSTGNYICSEVWVPLPVGSNLYALPGAKGE